MNLDMFFFRFSGRLYRKYSVETKTTTSVDLENFEEQYFSIQKILRSSLKSKKNDDVKKHVDNDFFEIIWPGPAVNTKKTKEIYL